MFLIKWGDTGWLSDYDHGHTHKTRTTLACYARHFTTAEKAQDRADKLFKLFPTVEFRVVPL